MPDQPTEKHVTCPFAGRIPERKSTSSRNQQGQQWHQQGRPPVALSGFYRPRAVSLAFQGAEANLQLVETRVLLRTTTEEGSKSSHTGIRPLFREAPFTSRLLAQSRRPLVY